MKVIIKHGTVNYKGNRYSKGDALDITEHFYLTNISRFEKAAKKPTSKSGVINNDEPSKEKSKETKVDASPVGKTSNKPKSKKSDGKSK